MNRIVICTNRNLPAEDIILSGAKLSGSDKFPDLYEAGSLDSLKVESISGINCSTESTELGDSIQYYEVENPDENTPEIVDANGKVKLIKKDDLQTAIGNEKKWLIFVHGNNQTFMKNILKLRKLANRYDVNVIGFSWPSFEDNESNTFIVKYLAFLLTDNINDHLPEWIEKHIRNKRDQYKAAQRNAKLSDSYLLKFFQDVESLKFERSILFHSMAHTLLYKFLEETKYSFFPTCSNIILHQGDEVNKAHKKWIKKLRKITEADIYVTLNIHDGALELSDAMNHAGGSIVVGLISTVANQNFRLGNSQKHKRQKGVVYLNLSEVANFIDHSICFNDYSETDLFGIFNSMFNSENLSNGDVDKYILKTGLLRRWFLQNIVAVILKKLLVPKILKELAQENDFNKDGDDQVVINRVKLENFIQSIAINNYESDQKGILEENRILKDVKEFFNEQLENYNLDYSEEIETDVDNYEFVIDKESIIFTDKANSKSKATTKK